LAAAIAFFRKPRIARGARWHTFLGNLREIIGELVFLD